MPLITGPIPPQNFEVVRDRICTILNDEIPSQANLIGNDDLNAKIFCERSIPFSEKDVPCINVMLSKGDFGEQPAINQNGEYSYFIDAYMTSKSSDTKQGDIQSNLVLQRLLGVIRAILSDSQYKTLGLAPPAVSNLKVANMGIVDPNNHKETKNIAMGRILFRVKVPETHELISAKILAGHTATITIGEDGKQYFYDYEPETP